MTSTLVAFDANHLSAVSEFSKRLFEWERPHTSDFFRWRYIQCPEQIGLVALHDDRCVATLWAVSREYRIAQQRVTLLEPFDWYVLPELLQLGIGVRLWRRLKARPEPMLNVGGSDHTRSFLPRFGWRESIRSRSYLLPLASEALAPKLERNAHIPRAAAAGAASALCRPQTRLPPFRASVEEVDRLNEEIMTLYDGPLGYACVPVPSQAWHTWLTSGATGAGRFITLQYQRTGGSVVGWALGRVYTTHLGCEARIVHVFTPHPEVEVYAWMVSVLVQRLLAFEPIQIRASATCPVLGRALERNRFLPGPTAPVFHWSKQAFDLPEPLHLSGDTADKAVIPYDLK